MRNKHMSSMMQPTNFSDFNPLDVLAAAASLQRRTDPTADDNETEHQTAGSGNDEESKDGAEDEDGTETVKCEPKQINPSSEEKKKEEPASSREVGKIKVPANGETILVKKAGVEIVARNHTSSSDGKNGGVARANRTLVTLGDAGKMIIPTQKGNKALTVVRINKQQMTDHSYAFVCQLQNLKHEEDEGYSSRSSLDEETEELGRSCHSVGVGGLVGRASTPSTSRIRHGSVSDTTTEDIPNSSTSPIQTDISRKPTKIVIVSKESKLQRLISGTNIVSSGSAGAGGSNTSAVKPEGNAVLRTLLGQRPALQSPQKASSIGSKVVVAGNLSGRVINVLKSGNITLAPPVGASKPAVEEVTFATPLPQVRVKASEPEPLHIITTKGVEADQTNINNTQSISVVTEEEVIPESIGVAESQLEQQQLEQTEEQSSGEAQSSGDATSEEVVPSDDHQVDCDTPGLTTGGEGLTIKLVPEPQSPGASLQEPSNDSILSPLEEQAEESSRHWSEASTEDETSCDSKGIMALDRTPVMSPSTDYSSPLLSPVCERDVPMMSPLVDSQSSCDIFRLPTGVKSMSTSSSSSSPRCKTVKEVEAELSGDNNNTEDSEGIEEEEDSRPLSSSSSTIIDMPQSQEADAVTTLVEHSALQTSQTDSGSEAVNTDLEQPANTQQPEQTSDTEAEPEEGSQVPGIDTTIGVIRSIGDQPCSNSTTLSPQDEPITDSLDVQRQSEVVHHSLLASLEGKNSKNQYIIEDDESPVAKFGPPRAITDEAPSSGCASPITLAIPASAAKTQPLKLTDSQTLNLPSNMCVNSKTSSGKEPMKVIVTTESAPRSLFTAVRRPLVTGIKALPGNLQVLPVVPSSKSPSGVMHVVPVSGNRGLMTQIIPKSGGQLMAGVPMLGSKTVVIPDANKGRMSTLLVPVSVTSPPQPSSSISLVQNSKSTLLNVKQKESRRSRAGSESDSVSSPKPQRRDMTSPLVFHGRITPVPSTTSDTSELLSSPENSLHGGFSGIIMGGRQTPESGENIKPSRFSLDNNKDKMTFKTSSSALLDSDDSISSESGFGTKAEIGSIGTMGSLSWKNVESTRGLTPIGVGGSGGREFVRIQGSEVKTGIHVSDEDAMPPLEILNQKKGKGKTVDGKTIPACSRKRKKPQPDPVYSPPPPFDEIHPHMARLHPLIDHDYCMFTEFNAQIQSSIIATTESKTKIEKKYAKKSKAVRTKAGRALITEESIKTTLKASEEKATGKGKRGRLKKRSTSKDKVPTDDEVSLDGVEEPVEQPPPLLVETKPRKVEAKGSRTSERRAKMQALKDDKNYVKITGSYQNEFVYFATKNKRNRPRKSLEEANKLPNQKQPQVGGMAVFDWYKDLSRADKSSHFGTPTGSQFGTPTTSSPSSPAPYAAPETDVSTTATTTTRPQQPLASNPSLTTTTTSTATLPHSLSSSFRPEAPPIHESEVADLVCDLSEIDSLGNTSTTQVAPVNDVDLSSYLLGSHDVKSGSMPAGNNTENAASEELPSAYVDRMAEQVRSMLNSMGVDELEKLELKLGSVESTSSGMADASFDGFLGGFTPDATSSMPPPSTTNNLCDLDEINDSDLLRSDIGSMNTILGDVKNSVAAAAASTLKTSASAPSLISDNHGERLPAADQQTFTYSKTLEFGNVKLDKSELFPEVSTSTTAPDVSALAADSAPELTVVSMYWNDLPGLVLMGQQYVRLVDIHKQVLPAKDTGILKKRCQMMGLPIANCSELQRDFLVRYANAAKSKSTVIVSKEAAQTLIGFYVEPKSRPAKQTSVDHTSSHHESNHATGGKEKLSKSLPKPVAGTSAGAGELVQASPRLTSTPVDGGKSRTSGKVVSRKRRLTSGSLTDTSPDARSSPSISPGNVDLKRSARLRHKKICYSDMLLGNHFDNQEKEKTEVVVHETVEVTSKEPLPNYMVVPTRDRESESEVSDDHENKEVHKSYPEDLEMRRLKVKMRKKTLTLKEKRRLRRLREKVRKRDLKRRIREKNKADKVCTKKKAAAVVAAAMMGLAKSKKKLQATHVLTKKYNQEHCYAASPESSNKVKVATEPKEGPSPANAESAGVNILTTQPTDVVKVREEGKVGVSGQAGNKETSTPLPTDDIKEQAQAGPGTVRQPSPLTKQPRKHEPSLVEKKQEKLEEEVAGPPPPPPCPPKRTPLAVLHRDAVHRLNQRGRWQDGELHTHLYAQLDSACIRCVTCSEFLSVKRFLKHMHHQNNRDELAHVTLSQTLELRDAERVSEEERSLWTEFKTRREELLSQKTPVSRRSRSLSSKSAESKAKQVDNTAQANKTQPKKELLKSTSLPCSPKTPVLSPPEKKTESVVKKAEPKPRTSPLAEASPVVTRTPKQGTPVTTRHSTRVRKRKQLHPIEKYVFSKASPTEEPEDKRPRLDATVDGRSQNVHTTPTGRKVRMKLSPGEARVPTPKYALRGPVESSKH